MAGKKQGQKRGGDDAKKISGYFPRAKMLKTGGGAALGEENVSILLFYTYVEPLWSEQRQKQAMDHCLKQGANLKLGGRIRVAREGFNATVSGTFAGVRKFAESLKKWDAAAFASTDFKFVDGEPLEKHFTELKVFPVAELVHYGLNPKLGQAPKLSSAATHLDAAAFHAKLQEEGTVVIDVRNHYEIDIGHFESPNLLDPQMRVSTDFPSWAKSEKVKEELKKGKQVLMYCTGGIRCERASGLIRQQGCDTPVFQLKGGIEKYLQEHPDGGLWRGKNFTFDKRGDITRSTTEQSAAASAIISRCCACAKPWDTYLGKRKCAGGGKAKEKCGVPVLVCEDCLTKRVPLESLRCPLCSPQPVLPTEEEPAAAKSKKKKKKNKRKRDAPCSNAAAEAGSSREGDRRTEIPAPQGEEASPPKRKKRKKTKKNKPAAASLEEAP